jgi:hypothetical protein
MADRICENFSPCLVSVNCGHKMCDKGSWFHAMLTEKALLGERIDEISILTEARMHGISVIVQCQTEQRPKYVKKVIEA